MAKEVKTSLEENIGVKWFARIGILALVIGIGYFIKYAIDNNLIDHLTRILIGLVIGFVLIITGEIMAKKDNYLIFARTLTGGGVALMYFSMYAAYYFEEYRKAIGINLVWDSVFLTIIVILGIFLSMKDDSKTIAAEAFFLGFITSLLSKDFQVITLIYNLLLSVGLVILVVVKRWSVFSVAGILATYFTYLLWSSDNANSFGISVAFLSCYFVIYTFQSFFAKFEKDEDGLNVVCTLINSFAFFFFSYSQIAANYPQWKGLYLFSLAVIFFFLYLLANIFEKEKLSYTYLALALFSLTLAIPVQLNDNFISIAWALETLVLTYVGIKSDISILKVSSYIVGGLTFLKTIFYDSWVLEPLNLTNLLASSRIFSFIITVVVFYVCAYLLRVYKKWPASKNSYVFAATFILALTIFLEAKGLWITLLLTLCVLLLTLVGLILRDSFAVETSGLILSTFILFRILLIDSSLSTADNIFQSTRALTIGTVIVIFYLCAWIKFIDKEDSFAIAYSWAATFLTVFLLGLEMSGYYLSIAWAVFGFLLLMYGFLAGKSRIRLQAIVVLGLAILKIFLYDVWQLETIYRTLSFIILGVLLLLASFMYSKFSSKLKEIVKD